jgi:serine/threonine protein phosphatase PrpC
MFLLCLSKKLKYHNYLIYIIFAGDFSFKCMTEMKAEEQRVSCEPDFQVYTRTDKDDILLLACDGLWDVFGNPEAINEVRHLFSLGEDSMELVANEILDTSLSKGKLLFFFNILFVFKVIILYCIRFKR